MPRWPGPNRASRCSHPHPRQGWEPPHGQDAASTENSMYSQRGIMLTWNCDQNLKEF